MFAGGGNGGRKDHLSDLGGIFFRNQSVRVGRCDGFDGLAQLFGVFGIVQHRLELFRGRQHRVVAGGDTNGFVVLIALYGLLLAVHDVFQLSDDLIPLADDFGSIQGADFIEFLHGAGVAQKLVGSDALGFIRPVPGGWIGGEVGGDGVVAKNERFGEFNTALLDSLRQFLFRGYFGGGLFWFFHGLIFQRLV